jgi:hypothetical protein
VGPQAFRDNPPAAAVESSANCTRGIGFFVKKTTQYHGNDRIGWRKGLAS